MTPAQRLDRELEKTAFLADVDPRAAFEVGEGHTWLLLIGDGLNGLLAYCLATHNGGAS